MNRGLLANPKYRIICAAVIAVTMLVPKTVLAATVSFDRTASGAPFISIHGPIELGDDKKFNELASANESAAVVLDSPGGLTISAINIGKAIRIRGYPTIVFDGMQCDSSCALIWLAGSPRSLSRSAKIGFHAAYTSGAAGSKEASGLGNAIVGSYLTLLNLPERAVIFATVAGPNALNYLTAANLKASGMDASVIEDLSAKVEEVKVAKPLEKNLASAPTIVPATATSMAPVSAPDTSAKSIERWSIAGDWAISVDHTLSEGCFTMASWESGTQMRIGFDPSKGLRNHLMLGNPHWASLSRNTAYEIRVKFDGHPAWVIKSMAVLMGKQIVLYKDFENSDFVTEFRGSGTAQIFYNGKLVDELNLGKNAAAVDELQKCQAKHRVADPFAG